MSKTRDTTRRGKAGSPKRQSRFEALVAELKKKGVKNPRALAAWIGRKKYGEAGFAALRKRRGAK